MDLVTQDDELKADFIAMPHYYHTFVAYACSFLLKLHTRYHNHLGLQHQDIFSAIHQIVQLCQRSECALYHPVHWMGAGLQDLAHNCEATLSKQHTDRLHDPGDHTAFGSIPPSATFFQSSGQLLAGNDGSSVELGSEQNASREAAMLFPGIPREFVPNSSQMPSADLDGIGNVPAEAIGLLGPIELQQEWGPAFPAFSSEYMGFGLL